MQFGHIRKPDLMMVLDTIIIWLHTVLVMLIGWKLGYF